MFKYEYYVDNKQYFTSRANKINTNLLHRDGNYPALIRYLHESIDLEYYYENGIFHREDGAACIHYQDNQITSEEYWIKGKRHRIDGPAVPCPVRRGRTPLREIEMGYYLNGIRFYKEQHSLLVKLDHTPYKEEWSLDFKLIFKVI